MIIGRFLIVVAILLIALGLWRKGWPGCIMLIFAATMGILGVLIVTFAH